MAVSVHTSYGPQEALLGDDRLDRQGESLGVSSPGARSHSHLVGGTQEQEEYEL